MTQDAPSSDGFQEHLASVNLSGARLGYLLSAVLMPAGFTLDWAMYPQRLASFFWIRAASGVVALALLGACYLPFAERHPVLLGAGPPLVCASAIEAMVLKLGGVASPYYAGLNLCILAVGVLYTWHWRHAVAVSGAIVGMWLIPGIPSALHGTLAFRPFFNNLYFLSLTTVISVSSTVIRYRSAAREFSARTDLAETSRVLAGTLERLREVDKLKNEFFANISHELRTPLTLILAPVEELLSRETEAPNADSLRMIRRNAHRLLRLIDDLLDLARLDVGGLRLIIADLDLSELARRVVDAAHPAAQAHSIELKLDAPAPTQNLFGDQHRMEMVLTNLLGNALKFMPDGGHVTVRVRSDADGATAEVVDDGPGIPEAARAHIFERFYQAEGSERRRHGGAGIGLALVRELCQLHDGKVEVDSEPGRGSTFRVWLPAGRGHFRDEIVERRRAHVEAHPGRRIEDQIQRDVPAAPSRPPASAELEPLRMERGRRGRVVVAEDEDDLRTFIESALSSECEVFSARDGGEALELARAHRPDLILTDVMMPGVSGIDLCRAVREDRALQNTSVIVLTALTGSDAALEGYNAGADDFITKPFHTRVLVARVRAQLRLRALGLQLADQARLSMAGVLSAGIAHEVKNPINALLNATRVLRSRGSSGQKPAERLLEVIEQSTRRVVDILSALEDHVRPADGAGPSCCDVRAGIDSSLRLLEHKMADVRVHRAYGTARSVVAPPRELNQVFLNLLDNAVRASPQNIWIGVNESRSGIAVSIADDGGGVPPDVAGLIFQPFFTTRPVGEGTGLGLYLCRRIVEDCGGSLSYRPRSGGGSEFVAELPALEAAA
jgi:signal transduction histidine kinase